MGMLKYIEQSMNKLGDVVRESDPAKRLGRAEDVLAKLKTVESDLIYIKENIGKVDAKNIFKRI